MYPARPLPRLIAPAVLALLILSVGCKQQVTPATNPASVLPTASESFADPSAKAALPFLSESMADAESAIRYGQVEFSTQADMEVPGEVKPVRVKYRSSVHFAFDGAIVRSDTKTTPSVGDKVSLTSSVCDGKVGRIWDRTQFGGRTPVSLSILLATPKRVYKETDLFYKLALLRLRGEPLSTLVLRDGISATRSGDAWEVKLSQPNGLDGYQVVRIRPDRSYRVESLAIYSKDRKQIFEAKVEKWIKLSDRLWLPARTVHRYQGDISGETRYTLNKCNLTVPPPHRLFELKDDGRTPIYDDRTHRVVREAKRTVVPTTGNRLMSTARFLASISAHDTNGDKPDTTTVHDNGARNEPGRCGLECVWLVAELQGKHFEWRELKSAYPGKDGLNSLKELRDAAARCGLKLAGLKVPQSQLQRIGTPFILYLEEGHHFCLVAKLDSRFAYIYNPPGHTERVPINRLLRVWGSGYMLARQPIT